MSDFLSQIANLSPKRLALLALELHDELEAVRRERAEPVAIVGIGCRFPGGADGPDAFWRILAAGVDTVSEAPVDRFDIDRYYDPDPDAPGKTYCRYGAFLSDVDGFDAPFFGIAPREAEQMDPQQRLLLETAWEALENAGGSPASVARTKTGVFIGQCAYDHALLQLNDASRIGIHTSSGAAPSILANRLSYLLDAQGPSLTVDTACSSSLVSAHLACQSLRVKECDLALAGGVNLILSPIATIALSKGRMLAPDGRCKTFDAAADGYVRGEGCGVVVLMRLSDALAQRCSIYAVIRGSAVNQDGYGNGLTAPNLRAQQAVLRQALENAQTRPEQVDYIEAHGTGTSLGDPIEVEALRAVYGANAGGEHRCALGSVKTNIGHLEGAAGIAGLIKAALALRHRSIPPHLHFKRLNPNILLDGTPFFIPADGPADWPGVAGSRHAAVSSFGFGGTNVHVVLGEAPEPATDIEPYTERPLHVLALSAKSDRALDALVERYRRHLDESAQAIADVCFTASAGRSHFEHRLAVVCDSATSASARLSSAVHGTVSGATRTKAVAFLFTGQGAQYAGMGRGLYKTQPVFHAALDRCEEALRPHVARPLLSILHEEPGATSLLDQTEYAQPALFAIEYALAEMWKSWGVRPAAVLGHSVGELAAACIAGALTLEDAAILVAARGRLMQSVQLEGGMAAAFAGERDVVAAIGERWPDVSIAALNSPLETVISGPRLSVEAAVARLQEDGFKCTSLHTSHAFHSPLMDPILDPFEDLAAKVKMEEPSLTFVSGLTGRPAEKGTLTQARYWRGQARRPVRFADGVKALYERGYRCFVEIGPHPVLTAAARQCIETDEAVWMPSLRRGRDDWETALASLSAFYMSGGAVDWAGFDSEYRRQRVALPTYPFERQPIRAEYRQVSEATARYEGRWQRQPLRTPATWRSGDRWLILADGCATVIDQLARELAAREQVATVARPNADSVDWGGREWRGVVYVCRAKEGEPAHDSALRLTTGALGAVQSLLGAKIGGRLALVALGASPESALARAPLAGFAKVVTAEQPELRCVGIEVDDQFAIGEWIDELAVEDGEDYVRYHDDGRREILRLERVTGYQETRQSLDAEATYVVTGGLGALGLEAGRCLVEQGARRLSLLGRRAPGETARRVIAELESMGARVTAVSADVSRFDELSSVWEGLERPIRGIVHCAGVLDDGILPQLTPERFAAVFAPKVAGAWNLHRLSEDDPLDFFVLFSSMASLTGPPGQANYVAASAFLDALAHYRRDRGLTATSLNWGPWSEAGMAADGDDRQQGRREEYGIRPITPADGRRMLAAELGRSRPQTALLDVDWAQFLGRIDESRIPSPLRGLAPARPRRSDGAVLQEQIQTVPARRRSETVLRYVGKQVARIAGLDPLHPLDPERPLRDLGLDSLMITELAQALSVGAGLPVPAASLFTYPTVADLSAHLLGRLYPEITENGAAPVEGGERDGLIDEVRGLSESELEAFLTSRPAAIEEDAR